MVVIVIRAQPKDSGEEIYPQRTSYSVENPPRVFASSRMPETYDERDCFNESWPSSHDLGLNANLEPRNSKFVNGNRTLYNKTPERIPWEGEQERCFGYSDSCARGYTSEQRTSEYRLDSPLSKDSGFSDKVTPCKTKRIAYYRVPETREKFIRQTRLPSSTTFLERNRHNVDNNNSTAYLSCSSQVDPEDSIATTKEEEWVTKKKIELTTTRQIETRVKRQVVLEDGKVVEDSGPMVTTNTTEDTEKQEHNQTEHRTLGDDNEGENWISVSNPTGCVKEVQEKTVKSREETEERLETENVQHLGDISDEGYMTAIKSGSDDFRQALEVSNRREIAESGPKIIHQSLKTKKYIDTEDKKELSQVQPGGKIVNETRTTRLHEEYGDCNVSDDEDSFNSGSLYETTKKENSQRYKKTKEQDITEYIANGQKIGEKLHYQAETTEGEREGDHFNMDEMDSLATRLKRMRLRSQNRLALENDTTDHKDVLTKKSSNFDQEEETRKAETSKWLEYHFGSESTKSSKGSVEDLDDIVPSTQSSFISVTMKSQPLKKTPKTKYLSSSDEDRITSERVVRNFSSDNDSYISPPGKGGYFQGISQWSSKKEEKIEPSVIRASNVQSPSFYKERSYSPLQSKPQIIRNHYNSTTITKTGSEDRYSPAVESVRRFQPISQTKSDASISSKTKIKTYEFSENRNQSPASFYQYSDQEKNRPSPPQRKKKEMAGYGEKDFEVRSRRVNGPSFDAEPKSDHISLRSSTPKDEDATTFSLPANKKLYQRTRFAADIPPPQPRPVPVKQKSKIGESFRKFVGKLRSSSGDRKNKKRSKSNGSRSPSPRENTYQNYNSLDNYGSLVDRGAEEIEEPIAPPRGKYNGNVHSRPTGDGDRSLQRYYLGEDPFSASIYGREKEYEENKNLRNRRLENDTGGEGDFKSRTLGRFSKSTSRLINAEVPRDNYSYDRGGVRTLPRKFRDEINDKPVNSTKSSQEPSTYAPNRWKFNKRHLETKESLPHSGSMINVSIVNQPYDTMKRSGIHLQGPAKPARTYRTNLSRSQSFNVEPGERGFKSYKSNPHLHSLDETAPLESPSIISNWSQSSKYLSEDRSKIPETKDKRKLFMKGLYDRAPELFKTLHGDHLDEVQNMKLSEPKNYVNYSNSFRSTSTVNTNSSSPQYNRYIPRDNYIKTSPVFTETYQDDNVIKTVSRSESSGNDDYSETVRIKSKSDDPLNPSETDTVKIFSKKKIPLKNGHTTETIESSETKTIVKSQGLRGGLESDRSFYNRSPSGVVIKVRNSRN